MIDPTALPPPASAAPRSRFVSEPSHALVDRALVAVGGGAACIVGLVLLVIAVSVIGLALPSIRALGAGFILGRAWDPVHGELGALPFLYGTIVTSLVALLLAVPVAIGVALFLTDLGPPALRRPVAAVVELLAAVPGVVYGLWAAIVLAPLLRTTIEPALESNLGMLPFFQGPKVGVGLLCASLVLAIMILPTIASVSREVLRAVPSELREGGLALGATPWDVVRRIVLPHAKSGIFGAILLGFGRAVGETMAVAMVVGSRAEITGSLLSPGYTMASVVANEFAEATSTLHVAALAEIGLLLFALTLAFNVAARILVSRVRGPEAALTRVIRPEEALASADVDGAYAGRKLAARAASALSGLAVVIALVPLVAILVYIARRGLGALSLAFFTELPRPVGENGGGMANAIVGTLELIGLASLMGIPIGIAAGLFLAEYRTTTLARVVRFCADVLAGVPSILVGVVVYATVVVRMKHFSTLAGAGALAVLMLPLVARTTDELARTVPESLREAALALGASRWRIAIHVVLRTAAPGIRAGCMLAVARVSGETAPLLFTAFNNRFWNESFSDPTSSLQVQIFTYTMSPYDDWHAQAWAAALVLVAIVIVLNLAARRVLRAPRSA